MLDAKRFNISAGVALAKDVVKAIREAEATGDVLVIEPGKYNLDAPLHVLFDEHHTEAWGVSAFGATFFARYTDPVPVLTMEATGAAQLRNFAFDGLGLRAQNRSQKGLKMMAKGTDRAFYRFTLNRLSIQGCDDAIDLEGNVFEVDISFPSCSDGNCGLALGNPKEGGIISAINVWGGSLSQNFVDGVRTYADVRYHEPYDFSVFGTYLGNNGRYCVNATAGVTLLKGVRVENPWSRPEDFPDMADVERACVKLANFGTLEQVTGGGNGNATCLVDGYLSGNPLTMRECSIYNDRGLKVKLAKLDGNEGKAAARFIGCRQRVEYSDKVRVIYEQ